MNPAPAVLMTVFAVSLGGALFFVAMALIFARVIWPRVEAWCARQKHPLIAAFACSEDAALPNAAKQRARELFLAKLDARQRRSWHVRRRFDVTGASGRRYTLSDYRPFNVRTKGTVLCVAVDGAIPVYDKLLAQKLLIECDDARFLASANVRGRLPR
jgi:hypothetical protein